ncbi:leucyl/phenylalanyl-tRNA--protein transferase [Thauera linaloolentis]|uniref:Leucyl/phenylalanyl-tRNA--protein transferase n=1 Tax=Thauera linaloolentis (strain DSM 12138 / JCM 21573 / CCUG 41526 / CIP 105981 / IAM 15112 / NBRC 102519 / 47Lol) TaxID=1123367 RepID=N6YAH9_THAL4|nr:leucyl/phenylalanyl-tRNA--protein transferase [Thauera linaloolentis]ENO88525.1 leucyl/phenylalanyl-tRNA--protein transferase [Thauera linaloolentis 47Lol = DSM 12138]MCM8564898.1 leucyl/phenylalanyl-tRNA--protein transferase [Thauera linaloolentis]
MIPWLDDPPGFPPVEQALDEPNGLLAAGGGLSPEWLLAAYRQGIFPWFNPGEPILWWSPDPRLVLAPGLIRISRSLRKVLRRRHFEIRFDTRFEAVIDACAAPRAPGLGTWITPEVRAAYQRMHELGYAHSVESWRDGRLVGGLYGMALGRIFFGESMFSIESDASKSALAHLARFLHTQGYAIIDCQMTTTHLVSMGAHEISRRQFCSMLAEHASTGTATTRWRADAAQDIDWG